MAGSLAVFLLVALVLLVLLVVTLAALVLVALVLVIFAIVLHENTSFHLAAYGTIVAGSAHKYTGKRKKWLTKQKHSDKITPQNKEGWLHPPHLKQMSKEVNNV